MSKWLQPCNANSNPFILESTMQCNYAFQVSPSARLLTTEEFAAAISLKAQSIRKRYSLTGSYHGVRPIKLPNRRLLWPANAIEQLASRTCS